MSRTSRIKSTFESIAGLFLMVGLFAISIGLIMLFLKGATFMAEKFLPFLTAASGMLFWILLLIALPISFIKRARGVMSIVLLISSYVFGITGWLIGFVLTYYYWGAFWLILGLFFAGVGVVPLGLLASAFNGGWGQFWNLLFILVITYATRIYSFWLSEKYEEYQYLKSNLQFENIIEGELVKDDENVYIEKYDFVNKNNFSLGNDSSILLVGERGTGKTELIKTLLEQLKQSYTPEEINFVLFDLNKSEFQNEDVEYLYKNIVTSAAAGIRALRDLVEYAELRIRRKQKYPAILVYIDNVDIPAIHQEKFEKLLTALIDNANAANFCVIYSISHVSAKTISKKLINHFEIILASRLPYSASKHLNISDMSEMENYQFTRFAVPIKEDGPSTTSLKIREKIELEESRLQGNKLSTQSSSDEDDELEEWDKIKERG